MTDQEILAIFERTHALLRGDHFVYTSGMHGSVYLNKDAIYPHTALTSALCLEIARRVIEAKPRSNLEVVVGPALGGIVLSQWVAHHLSALLGREVLGIYTEKTEEGLQRLTRGYDALVSGKHVLVVEDVLTTGGSVRKVIEAVRTAGGVVDHVFSLLNRDPKTMATEIAGAPLSFLFAMELQAWDATQCPLCKEGKPINRKVGKGKSVRGPVDSAA